MTKDEAVQAALEAELARLPVQADVAHDDAAAIVIVPSMTFDRPLLEKVKGVDRYEERLLCYLLQLADPRLHMVFCSSTRISADVVDYYLQMIVGVPMSHSRRRLTMVACDDASPRSLTEKLLERPDLQAAIRAALPDPVTSAMVCMNTTDLERQLAHQLGITLLGNPPELDSLGSKSSSRELFIAAGIDLPNGRERLRDESDIALALSELKAQNPRLRRAVVKLEEGFSGEGNALFDYSAGTTVQQIRAALPTALQFQSADERWEKYSARFREMGGVVEEFLEDITASPSGQGYLSPGGSLRVLSTHDQVLGGVGGQVFQGSTFPARAEYRRPVQEHTFAVGEKLGALGARGRFAVDYVVAGDRLCAIEINLRKGGTTHPAMTLAMVTEGEYNADTGEFVSAGGHVKTYYSTDNLSSDQYVGMTIDDLFDVAVRNELLYDAATERGAVFHMLGALEEFGKVGVTCIANSIETALRDYQRVITAMDEWIDSSRKE